jgi:hypothetical protein
MGGGNTEEVCNYYLDSPLGSKIGSREGLYISNRLCDRLAVLGSRTSIIGVTGSLLSQHLSGETEGSHRNIGRIVGLWEKIRSGDIPNIESLFLANAGFMKRTLGKSQLPYLSMFLI